MSNTSQTPAVTRQHNPNTRATTSSPQTSSADALTSDSDSTLIPLTPRTSSTARASPVPEEEEIRCWICFASEGEEDKPRGEWKAPCKCTLVAHEACLLDWIADMQKTGIENGSNQKPACPQCKTPIRLKEEQSVVLDMVDQAGRIAGKAGAFVAFGGTDISTHLGI